MSWLIAFRTMAVTEVLGRHASRITGRVLDAGGGAAGYGRVLPGAALESVSASDAEPGAYGCVLSIERLQLAEDPAAEVAALAAACAPGAFVLVTVPAMLDTETEDIWALSPAALAKLAERAGLAVESARYANCAKGGAVSAAFADYRGSSQYNVVVPADLLGWAAAMDARFPFLSVLVATKP